MSFLHRVARIGADPDDDDDIRLQKSLLVVCAIPFVFAGAAWGLMYILFGERLAGMIPLSYAVISLLSIFLFGLTRHYYLFRFSQLILILLLPRCSLHAPVGDDDTDSTGGTPQRGILAFRFAGREIWTGEDKNYR